MSIYDLCNNDIFLQSFTITEQQFNMYMSFS